jgi:hypothetical protein
MDSNHLWNNVGKQQAMQKSQSRQKGWNQILNHRKEAANETEWQTRASGSWSKRRSWALFNSPIGDLGSIPSFQLWLANIPRVMALPNGLSLNVMSSSTFSTGRNK